LLDQRDEIDRELALIITGAAIVTSPGAKKTTACSVCGAAGHNARACPKKEAPPALSTVPNGNDAV
jgi:hypothetical protein